MWLTRDGVSVLGLALAVGAVAFVGGQNLLYLVACAGVGLLVTALFAGAWNLRNLDVVRALPDGVYADRPADGAVRVRNQRRWGAAIAVWVEDEAGASVLVPLVEPNGEVRVPVTWRFGGRGRARLGRVRLQSTFPFGLVAVSRTVGRPADLVVWPTPRSGVAWAREGELAGTAAGAGAGGAGDFLGLRDWAPGDSIRRVHWRTSARVGTPVIVQRARDSVSERDVVVPDLTGSAWEEALGRAAGAVDDGLRDGRRVRLTLPAELLDRAPSRSVEGEPGRRQLLDALALLPPRADGAS
ncbi:MAG: hypothetical protein ACI8PZ_005018 [Myxococcota bacterium]|jgi:uncharacterized protein (DUF58 family)